MLERYRSIKTWIADSFDPLRPIYDAWMRAIAGFSWLLARVMLTFAFFTVFLLYGVVLRLIGKDPMNRTIDENATSYWTDNVIENDDIQDFEKQY